MAEIMGIHSTRTQHGGRKATTPERLWRDVLGERLRSLRLNQGETLVETAIRAGVSPQYLSEVERGRKEPSSEMIAAIAGALDTTLVDLTARVSEELRRQAPQQTAPRTADQGAVLLLAA
jgi:transcriptional regulator with XRE-family HTH domain